MSRFFSMLWQTAFFFSILRITAPILFAALGAVVSEKAGCSNIGLEGIMMISALFGALFSYWTQSWLVGVLAAVVIGALVAFMIGFFALKLKTDIILAGIAVNMIGDGGTQFFLYLFTGMSGSTSGLTSANMLIPTVRIPLIADIPVVGEILSGHSVLTYVAFLMVLVMWAILQKTPLGLNIRAVGENPNAASSVGVSVLRYKYIALMMGGALAGLGGAFMSMYYSQSWNVNMVAGRGFIALAAEAMGNHTPLGAMLSSMLFGLAQAVSIKVAGLPGISSDIVSAIPYAITIIGLAIYAALQMNRARNDRRIRVPKAAR